MDHRELHRVATVCVIYNRKNEFLIGKRNPQHKVFPGKWCSPGGGINRDDYETIPQTLPDGWADPHEIGLRREIREEMGIEVGAITFLGSFSHIRPDNIAVLGLRFAAPYKSGVIRLQQDEIVDARWINLGDLLVYEDKMLGGLSDSIRLVHKMLQSGKLEAAR